MNFKRMDYGATRVSLAMFVVVMGMSAPASAKPARFEQAPTVAATTDDRFPWLEKGYVTSPQPQAVSRRERKSRQSGRVERVSRREAVSRGSSQQGMGGTASFGSSGLVSEARRFIGSNPTGRSSLWCARFMNFVLERSGRKGSGSDMASSFASYGARVSGPQVGAIAVMSRGKRGGHVGIVSGIDADGNPIIISGNHGRRVAESAYPRGRVYAYVMP